MEGNDGLSAPVQQCLWDSGGFLPPEELPWGMVSGRNVDQVMEEANSEEEQWPCTVLPSLDMLPVLSENSFKDARKRAFRLMRDIAFNSPLLRKFV